MKFARSGRDIADNVPVINYSFVSRQTIINASLSLGAPLARLRHRRFSGVVAADFCRTINTGCHRKHANEKIRAGFQLDPALD
jgi:hypothetical protein